MGEPRGLRCPLARRARRPDARLLPALIQLAAAEIKRFSEMQAAAQALAERALVRLAAVLDRHLGVDVRALGRDAEARMAGTRGASVLRLSA